MSDPLRAPGKKDKLLAVIRPESAVRARYQQQLQKAIANMSASYTYWVSLRYKAALDANQSDERLPDPERAQDAASARNIKKRTDAFFGELLRLRKYWDAHFDKLAKDLAEQAVQGWYDANARAWHGALKRAGFDIPMQLSASQRVLLRVKVAENVGLIKTIPQQYHQKIEGDMLRAFTAGRDLKGLQDKLLELGHSTKQRAALIARDQANKATADMNAARQRELGLYWATWLHSSAGKEPRHDHVRAGREQWVFNTQEGIDFGDKFGRVLPGVAIRCRCTSRTIIPAIGRGDVRGLEDLTPVIGFPGAYRAKPGWDVGPKQRMDVTKTRLPGETVRYS